MKSIADTIRNINKRSTVTLVSLILGITSTATGFYLIGEDLNPERNIILYNAMKYGLTVVGVTSFMYGIGRYVNTLMDTEIYLKKLEEEYHLSDNTISDTTNTPSASSDVSHPPE